MFHVSDIVTIICSHLEPQDTTRVARTSRFHFYCAVPFAWQHIKKGSSLLRLVPRVTIQDSPYNFYDQTYDERAPGSRLVRLSCATLYDC